MVMSNYMDLLGMYAPWFLILFMVVPMTLAELVLCSEIFSLLNKGVSSLSFLQAKARKRTHKAYNFFIVNKFLDRSRNFNPMLQDAKIRIINKLAN